MHYRVSLSALLSIFLISGAFAHAALLFIEDNGNGTVYIEAGISTGESATGSKIIIKDKATGQPLSTLALPDSGKINIPMPNVPYTVTLDMGTGHVLTKSGPFKEGSTLSVPEEKIPHKTVKSSPIIPIAAGGVILIAAIVLAALRRKKK